MESLIGQIFHRLTVIGGPFKTSKNLFWECRCECGAITWVYNSHLLKGKAKQCITCARIQNISTFNSTKRPVHNKLPPGEASLNTLFGSYKRNAKGRGLAFDLTVEEFRTITKKDCTYCGASPSKQFPNPKSVELRFAQSGKHINGVYVYNGIDRIDNKTGYSKENCVPCCETCNYMKGDLEVSTFKNYISKIARKLGLF